MRGLGEAVRFLTVIPWPGRQPRRPQATFAAFPWAGLVVGMIMAATARVSSYLLVPLGASAAALLVWTRITGALHLDGLADLADGRGAGGDRERMLAIMADSRLGSFGAVALILVLILKVALLYQILESVSEIPAAWTALAAVPAVARGVLPVIMRSFPSARPGGMGERNRKQVRFAAVSLSLISVLTISAILTGLWGLLLPPLVLVFCGALALRVSRRLGGLTGDVYGALIEIGEVVMLVGLIILTRLDLLRPAIVLLLDI